MVPPAVSVQDRLCTLTEFCENDPGLPEKPTVDRGETAINMRASELFDIPGRVALVTGASSGLGARFAELLAANGVAVGLVARRRDRLAGVASRIEAAGGRVVAVEADVLSRDAMNRAFHALQAQFGTVTILLNNARIAPADPALDMPG